MIEEYPTAAKHIKRFTIIDSNPVCHYFPYRIWRAWMKWCCFPLWYFLSHAKHLTGRSLIELSFNSRVTNCFQKTNRSESYHVTRVYRDVKRNPNMRLSTKIVNLLRLDFIY